MGTRRRFYGAPAQKAHIFVEVGTKTLPALAEGQALYRPPVFSRSGVVTPISPFHNSYAVESFGTYQ